MGRFGWFGEQRLEDLKCGTPAYFCGLDDAGEDRDILRSVGAARPEAHLAEDDQRSQRAFRVVVGGRPPTAHEGEDLLVFARSGEEPLAEGLGLGEVQRTCANQIEDAEETRLKFELVGFRLRDLQGASPVRTGEMGITLTGDKGDTFSPSFLSPAQKSRNSTFFAILEL